MKVYIANSHFASTFRKHNAVSECIFYESSMWKELLELLWNDHIITFVIF